MLRVLIIVENLPLPLDRRVWQEAIALKDAGYLVTIISPKGKGYDKSHEVIDGIHIYRHALPFEADGAFGYLIEYSSALFWEFFLACKVSLGRGFDVIHGCNPPDTIFLIALFFKLFGKKYIFDHHDLNPELYVEKFKRKDKLYNLLLVLEKWTYKTADVAIVTNDSYKEIAVTRNSMKPENVFIVRSGPDLSKICNKSTESSLRKGRKYLVGYVGIMGAQDGIDCLLRVIKNIIFVLDRTDIQFILIGDGTELASMKKYASDLQIDDYVTFTGYLTGSALSTALNSIDIGICPDVYNEYTDKCTMNKIMEYMAMGKPVVQFDLAEGRFSAQEASLYVQPGDEVGMSNSICLLLDDPCLRTQMGEYGRQRIENVLDWKYEVPNLLAAYKTALGLNYENPN